MASTQPSGSRDQRGAAETAQPIQTAPSYREVLRPPWWAWLLPVAAGAFLGLAYGFALGALWGWLTAALIAVLGVVLLRRNGRIVAVDAQDLQVGRARLPWWAVGEVRELSAEETLAARRHRSDANAFVAIRAGYADTSVAIEVADPRDPHPYWLISTRHPEALASAIVRARSAAEARSA